MPSNIEIKARIQNRQQLEACIQRFTKEEPQVIHQKDIFFRCQRGRLKLRILDDHHGELIWYDRPNQPTAKRSDYILSHTTEPVLLHETLARAYDELTIVQKERTLYMIGQTRVHLDRVEQLGDFLELEVVLQADQTEQEGLQIASRIMQDLDIRPETLIDRAYADLLMDPDSGN